MSWEGFYPRYRVPQIASGPQSAAFALMFLVIALGVAFGHRVPTQRGDDCRCVFAGHFDQDGKTRMSFHQGCDVTVPGAAEQIALPMPGNGAVFNFCRPFPDREGIDDLTSGLVVSPRVQ
jgi:hypothetical protein